MDRKTNANDRWGAPVRAYTLTCPVEWGQSRNPVQNIRHITRKERKKSTNVEAQVGTTMIFGQSRCMILGLPVTDIEPSLLMLCESPFQSTMSYCTHAHRFQQPVISCSRSSEQNQDSWKVTESAQMVHAHFWLYALWCQIKQPKNVCSPF